MYAIYDIKAERYDTPFFCHSDLFAKRHFGILIDEGTMIGKYQYDFECHRLAWVNMITGEIDPHEVAIVITGKDVEKPEKVVDLTQVSHESLESINRDIRMYLEENKKVEEMDKKFKAIHYGKEEN